MAYEQFLETVRERLQTLLGPPHELKLRLVQKNNGVELDGISDSVAGSKMAPTVYLNSYYSLFSEGLITLDDICREIISIFKENPAPHDLCIEDLSNIEKMRPLIMMRLIHRGSNKTLLDDIPYLPYLDLAIVFYLSLGADETGQMTVMIHHEQMASWNLTVHDLLDLALENTPAVYPAQIHSMVEVLKGFAHFDAEAGCDEEDLNRLFIEEAEELPLFVLTNSSGIYGASCMLYRKTLKNFADLLNCDLIIIPSSVHEVLLVPYVEDLSLSSLNQMVKEINLSEVPREERLSDHVYRYCRQTDDISIPLSQIPAAPL